MANAFRNKPVKEVLQGLLRSSCAAVAFSLAACSSLPAATQQNLVAGSAYASNPDGTSVWAGHAAVVTYRSGARVTRVGGDFTVPKVSEGCDGADNSHLGKQEFHLTIWAGIGGIGEKGLAQIGVDAGYYVTTVMGRNGVEKTYMHPKYVLFYNMLQPPPNADVSIDDFRIKPGDKISISVAAEDGDAGKFLLRLADKTQNRWISIEGVYPASSEYGIPRLSGEWIAEAPAAEDGVGGDYYTAPLPRFGSVTFTNINVEFDDPLGVGEVVDGMISYNDDTRMKLTQMNEDDTLHDLIDTSPLSRDGSEFRVTDVDCNARTAEDMSPMAL